VSFPIASSVSDVDGNCMSARCDGIGGSTVLEGRDCDINMARSCENANPGNL
jgi:hypothetical protein